MPTLAGMSLVSDVTTPAESPLDLDAALATVRSAFDSGTTRPLEWRRAQLDGLLRFLDDHEDALVAALATDLGRPRLEAYSADIGASANEISHIADHFEKWARPRRARIPLVTRPGRGEVRPEPLGVALVIAPWNYPVYLLLCPLAAALAAGNAVVAKPSELSPATASVLTRNLPDYLDRDAFAIFEGGPDVSTALLERRFDHIFFTGSTRVGYIVMEAAAKHLTPVTLELGGKSPCVVDDDVDVQTAANRIAWGKGLNAGQTCIAPDYVLVGRGRRDELVDAIAGAWRSFYGENPADSPDFGRIVSDRHHGRLVSMLAGEDIAVGGEHDTPSRYLAPTVVIDPAPDSPLMTEEIFGPILPIVTVEDVDDAIAFVRDRPKPLALYVFSDDDDTVDRVLEQTSSGGVCVNHTIFHITPPDLPFGGVGPSGMGRYHGRSGFDTFSNLKSVLRKPVRPETSLIYPPYGSVKQRILRWFT